MKISTKVNENLELNSDSIYIKGVGGYDGTNPDDASDLKTVVNSKGTYSKPSTGIPASDLASGVIPDVSGKANTSDLVFVAGSGSESAVLKNESNSAISEADVVEGYNNFAGLKGYKWASINFSTNVITFEDTPTGWVVGDVLTLVQTGGKYHNCSTITAISDKNVTVDSLPFSSESSTSEAAYDNHTAYIILKPTIGNFDIGLYAHAEGWNTSAQNAATHTEGYGTMAVGHYGHAEGKDTVAYYAAHAEGELNIASGICGHAEGRRTKAIGGASHAEGADTEANAFYSHAEGQDSKTNGSHSHAEGKNTTTIGNFSHAEGKDTIAAGEYSHAGGIGDLSQIIITGAANAKTYTTSSNHNLKVGDVVEYNGTYAKVIEITSTTKFKTDATLSSTDISGVTALRCRGIAYGVGSYVEGQYNTASGSQSHAEGRATIAYGHYSHAEGNNTKTSNYGEYAGGNYNVTNHVSNSLGSAGNTVHSVGCGTSANAAANALEIMQNGNVYIKGFGGYNGTNPSSATPINTILTGANKMVVLTQAQYDALRTKDANTLYFIK